MALTLLNISGSGGINFINVNNQGGTGIIVSGSVIPSPTPSPIVPSPTSPTPSPTSSPTTSPTSAPTPSPTPSPTFPPTTSPTSAPTTSPTPAPVTPAPTPTSGSTFSQTFTNNQSPTTAIENAWTTFRSQLTGTYTTMTLSSSLGQSITVTDAKVQDIANALRTATTGTNTTVTIGANTWRVAHGCVAGTATVDSIYITTGALCSCGGTYTIRPMIKNLNWGGLNGSACGQPTQTLTISFS